MRVTREKAAENRARIVETASRLFREKGFDGIGLDAIMNEAGLPRTSNYSLVNAMPMRGLDWQQHYGAAQPAAWRR